MKKNKINLKHIDKNNLIEDYFFILINTVAGYFLAKGYFIRVSNNIKKDKLLYVGNLVISLNAVFPFWFNAKELEYYLKVFLNQELDDRLTRILGNLYPRQSIFLSLGFDMLDLKNGGHLGFLEAFLDGVDPINKVYIPNLNQRILALDNWLQTLSLIFKDACAQEFFDIAVANLDNQLIIDYLFFCHSQSVCVKLTKEQYIRFLRFYICYDFSKAKRDLLAILKGEIGHIEIASQHEYGDTFCLHRLFPQVFPLLELLNIDQIVNFMLFDTLILDKILKNYACNLFSKYYVFLTLKFFIDINIGLNDLPAVHVSKNELYIFAERIFEPFCYNKLEHLLMCLALLRREKF